MKMKNPFLTMISEAMPWSQSKKKIKVPIRRLSSYSTPTSPESPNILAILNDDIMGEISGFLTPFENSTVLYCLSKDLTKDLSLRAEEIMWLTLCRRDFDSLSCIRRKTDVDEELMMLPPSLVKEESTPVPHPLPSNLPGGSITKNTSIVDFIFSLVSN